jgi:uncharacterized membrane protein
MRENRPDTIVGVFAERDQARDAISALQEAGFTLDDISILMRDDPAAREANAELATDVNAPAATGAVVGGVLGGAAGWLAALGAVAIPGIGPFVGAGVLASALVGAALGIGAGAIAGALVDLGVPDDEAHWYEQEAQRGRILVAVRAGERADEARRVLRQYGAYDVETRGAQAGGESYRGFPFSAT